MDEAWKATSALEKAESDCTDGVRTIPVPIV
jgi:hypothetical protein